MAILVSCPRIRDYPKHMDHFLHWFADNKHRHDLRGGWVHFERMHNALTRARTWARELECTHMLFTEDDHWGYPVDGLDVLLEADKDIIGFPSYSKRPPYPSTVFRTKGPDASLIEKPKNGTNITPIEQGAGPDVQRVNLITWAFLLVKMDVFDKLDAAGLDPFELDTKPPADSYFCQYTEDIGIKKYVHFGAVIGHGDIEPGARPFLNRMHAEMHRSGWNQQALDAALQPPGDSPERQAAIAAAQERGKQYSEADRVQEAAR